MYGIGNVSHLGCGMFVLCTFSNNKKWVHYYTYPKCIFMVDCEVDGHRRDCVFD